MTEVNDIKGISVGQKRVLADIEDWIRTDDEGKRWLGRLAAEVGVPVQMLLPLEDSEDGRQGSD